MGMAPGHPRKLAESRRPKGRNGTVSPCVNVRRAPPPRDLIAGGTAAVVVLGSVDLAVDEFILQLVGLAPLRRGTGGAIVAFGVFALLLTGKFLAHRPPWP